MLKSFKLKYFHFRSLEVLHIKVFLLQELKKNLDGLQSVDLVAFIAKIVLEWKKKHRSSCRAYLLLVTLRVNNG